MIWLILSTLSIYFVFTITERWHLTKSSFKFFSISFSLPENSITQFVAWRIILRVSATASKYFISESVIFLYDFLSLLYIFLYPFLPFYNIFLSPVLYIEASVLPISLYHLYNKVHSLYPVRESHKAHFRMCCNKYYTASGLCFPDFMCQHKSIHITFEINVQKYRHELFSFLICSSISYGLAVTIPFSITSTISAFKQSIILSIFSAEQYYPRIQIFLT